VADEGVKFALIADEPRVYFATPHFDGYASVLVRLAEIGVPELTVLVTERVDHPGAEDSGQGFSERKLPTCGVSFGMIDG
jgi:hypothetical protein